MSEPIMKLILPLDTTFGSKRKKHRKSDVTFSLNNFIIPLSKKAINKTYHKAPIYTYQKSAKKFLQDCVRSQLKDIPVMKGPWPKKVTLKIYVPDRRIRDVDNMSIFYKFVLDEIKKTHIPGDDWRYIVSNESNFCGVDKINPRAELYIRDMNIIDELDWVEGVSTHYLTYLEKCIADYVPDTL